MWIQTDVITEVVQSEVDMWTISCPRWPRLHGDGQRQCSVAVSLCLWLAPFDWILLVIKRLTAPPTADISFLMALKNAWNNCPGDVIRSKWRVAFLRWRTERGHGGQLWVPIPSRKNYVKEYFGFKAPSEIIPQTSWIIPTRIDSFFYQNCLTHEALFTSQWSAE